jgi:Protein of unknown function (DUF1570)
MTAAFSKAVVPVFAAVALALMPPIARSAWLSVETPSVRILTEFSQRDTDKIIQRIALHRYMIGLLFKSWHRFSGDIPPLVVVLHGDTWRTYLGEKNARGLTVETPGGQLILVNGSEWDNPDAAGTVLHEMTHYYFRLNARGIRIPVWYEEGSAEFFATTSGYRGGVRVGVPIEPWLRQLYASPIIPLDQLMSATRQSPAYWKTQGQFYAESWALIQYMRVDNSEAAAALLQYLSALQTLMSPEEAVRTTFGEHQQEFQANFARYARYGTMHWLAFSVPPQVPEVQTVRSFSEAEGRQTFGRILIDSKPKLATTLAYVEKGEKRDGPDSPLAAMLARLYYDRGRTADANTLLNTVCERGNMGAELQIECGNALLSRAHQRAIDPLNDARRAREFYQRAWLADPARLAAVTRQAETYSIAPDDSSILRATLEELVNRSDVSSLIWQNLAVLYGQFDKKKQLNCLDQALLSEHDIGESDRLRKELLALSTEIAESGSVPSAAPLVPVSEQN